MKPVNNPTTDKTIEIYQERGENIYYVVAGGVWIGTIAKTPHHLKPWTFCGQGVSLGGDSLEMVKNSVVTMLTR